MMTQTTGDTKSCGKCGLVKAHDEFYARRTAKPGHHDWRRGIPRSPCKACVKNKSAKWRELNPERKAEQNRELRELHLRLRLQIFGAYGGSCECCSETEVRFLTIDHRQGGGSMERAEVGNGLKFYRRIIDRGYPATYRLLCWNCNSARGVYGACPHETGEATQG